MHTYQIDDSAPAPQFKIIEQPNDFVKNIKALTKEASVNETMSKRLEFWTLFNDVIDERQPAFKKRKPTTDHWYSVAVGSSRCNISIDLINRENKIRVGLWIHDDKALFDKLLANKDNIEPQCSFRLNWHRLDNKKASYICTYINGLDFDNQENYTELMNTIIDVVVAFKNTFRDFL